MKCVKTKNEEKKKSQVLSEMESKSRIRRNKANARERNRMHGLNTALDRLRRKLPINSVHPGLSSHHKYSKIETLKIACNYIRVLTNIVRFEQRVDLACLAVSLAKGLSHQTASIVASSLGFPHLKLYDEAGLPHPRHPHRFIYPFGSEMEDGGRRRSH